MVILSRRSGLVAVTLLAALLACADQTSNPRTQVTQAMSCSPAVRRIPVDDYVYDISVGEGAVWILVGDEMDNYFIRSIDLRELSATDVRVPVGGPETSVFAVTAGEGAVWVPYFTSPPADDANVGKLLRVDPRNGSIASKTLVGKRSLSAIAGAGFVWLTYDTDRADGQVLLVDPQDEKVVDAIKVGRIRSEVMLSDGAAWIVTGEDGDRLVRIDLVSHELQTVLSDRASTSVADGAVWFVDEDGIGRYDLASGQSGAARYFSPVGPYSVSAGLGSAWLSRPIEQPRPTPSETVPGSPLPHENLRAYRVGIARIDPMTMKPISETVLLDVGAEPLRGAAFGDDAFWVPNRRGVLRFSLQC